MLHNIIYYNNLYNTNIYVNPISLGVIPVVFIIVATLSGAAGYTVFFETIAKMQSIWKQRRQIHEREAYHAVRSTYTMNQDGKGGINLNLTVTDDEIKEQAKEEYPYPKHKQCCEKCQYICLILCVLIIVLIAVPFGTFMISLLCEVASMVLIAAGMYFFLGEKFPHESQEEHEYWLKLFSYVYSNGEFTFSNTKNDDPKMINLRNRKNRQIMRQYYKNDKLIRIICINRVIHKQNETFNNYLKKQEDSRMSPIPYQNITFKDITEKDTWHEQLEIRKPYILNAFIYDYLTFVRELKEMLDKRIEQYNGMISQNNDPMQHNVDQSKIDEKKYQIFELKFGYYNEKFWFCYLGPVYFLSRIVNMIFPIVVIIYCVSNGLFEDFFSNDGEKDSDYLLFPFILLVIYCVLYLVLIFLFVFYVYPIHKIMWYIIPGSSAPKSVLQGIEWTIKECDLLYDGCLAASVRHSLLNQIFGNDVSSVIVSYLPPLDKQVKING